MIAVGGLAFYVHRGASLEPRTTYFDKPADTRAICAEDAIVVAESAACAVVGETTDRNPRTIVEPDGSPSFCVF